MMKCKRCYGPKTWAGDDRKCAFGTGIFSGDNWNCGTVNAIRDAMERGRYSIRPDCWRTRYNDCSIGVLAIEECAEVEGYFLVASWYKERGRCENMQVMGEECFAPSLKDAEKILDGVEILARSLAGDPMAP